MKITWPEWMILAVGAAFLLFCGGFLAGSRSLAQPFVVTAERQEAPPSASPAPAETSIPVLNLNTATAAQLQTLPGIGEKRAADIVAWRQAHGAFVHVEDITQVPGIGQGTLERILDYITVEADG